MIQNPGPSLLSVNLQVCPSQGRTQAGTLSVPRRIVVLLVKFLHLRLVRVGLLANFNGIGPGVRWAPTRMVTASVTVPVAVAVPVTVAHGEFKLDGPSDDQDLVPVTVTAVFQRSYSELIDGALLAR